MASHCAPGPTATFSPNSAAPPPTLPRKRKPRKRKPVGAGAPTAPRKRRGPGTSPEKAPEKAPEQATDKAPAKTGPLPNADARAGDVHRTTMGTAVGGVQGQRYVTFGPDTKEYDGLSGPAQHLWEYACAAFRIGPFTVIDVLTEPCRQHDDGKVRVLRNMLAEVAERCARSAKGVPVLAKGGGKAGCVLNVHAPYLREHVEYLDGVLARLRRKKEREQAVARAQPAKELVVAGQEQPGAQAEHAKELFAVTVMMNLSGSSVR